MALMRDVALEYFGGPKDGEAVQWPPRTAPLRNMPPRQECVDHPNVPHFIRVPSGSYKFDPVSKRYDWIG